MQCFEVMEKVKEGLLVRYPYLQMGYGSGEVKIPIWDDDRAWLNAELGVVEQGEQLLFTRAGLKFQVTEPPGGARSHRLYLTTAKPDDRALVLVRTVGENIAFRGNRKVKTLFAADNQGTPEQLMIFRPGGLLRITRDDVELEPEDGLPGAELILGWDGQRMHELHESAYQV